MNKEARTPVASVSKKKKAVESAGQRQSKGASAAAASAAAASAAAASAQRTWFVLGGLAMALAATGAFLKVTAPRPLSPDGENLYAVNTSQAISELFDTSRPIEPGRWKSIYVHQSLTRSGNAQGLAGEGEEFSDHFLIGNGDPLADGAIQSGPHWSRQEAAGKVPGVKINPDCLTICLVGDFNAQRPTPNQQARLLELLTALQRQLNIDSTNVIIGFSAAETSVAGVGRRFPISALRAQLLQPQ